MGPFRPIMRNTLFVLLFVHGCASPKKPDAVEPPPAAEKQCAANQFVACTSGDDCSRSRAKLIRAHECFDHAASACDALGCKYGCNIHGSAIGESNDVFCSRDARSSRATWPCGGYSNWQCPENMTCEHDDPRADDAMGTCVLDAR